MMEYLEKDSPVEENAAVDAEDEETNAHILEEMMEDLEKYWPAAENAAVDAEEEEIHVVAAWSALTARPRRPQQHTKAPLRRTLQETLPLRTLPLLQLTLQETLPTLFATEDAPQVYGALKWYHSHKRWWLHDMATNIRALTIYGLAVCKSSATITRTVNAGFPRCLSAERSRLAWGRLWKLWLCGQRRACVRAAKSINKQPNN